MILTREEVRYYLYYAGFRGLDLDYATDICFCESSFNTNAHNQNSREDSRGLMQINILANPQYQNLNLFDPGINTSVAFEMYQNYGFSPWSCANNIPNPSNLIAGGALVIGLGLLVYYIQ